MHINTDQNGTQDHALPGTTFVLVHGAWHGAWCWRAIQESLSGWGHQVIARDLPGLGANGAGPKSPFPQAPSAVAHVSMEEMVTTIVEQIDEVESDRKIVLVAHSMGGIPASVAAEHRPERLRAIVYVAAIMPPPGRTGLEYLQSAENSGALVLPLLVTDPRAIGALRIDPENVDADYRRRIAQAFYGRTDARAAAAALALLNPDTPAAPFAAPLATSASRWGRVPRHYVLCTEDMAVRPELQRRMIRDADLASNRTTHVHALEADHSPFLSVPMKLAHVLAGDQVVAD